MSPIFAIPGFSISYCQPDFMHTCDMGIVQYCTGNCMWEVFLELHGVRTRSTAACAKLENMVKLAAKTLGADIPFQGLTVNMIRKQGPGKKTKMALKAAEGRNFVPILHYMLSIFSLSTLHTDASDWTVSIS